MLFLNVIQTKTKRYRRRPGPGQAQRPRPSVHEEPMTPAAYQCPIDASQDSLAHFLAREFLVATSIAGIVKTW